MSEKTGLWMYCIVENKGKMKWDCLGIHGTSAVSVVTDGKFAAVVSEESMKKYPLDRDTLLAHARVSEIVMQTHRVLPVRFCTIAEGQDQIIDEVLRPKGEEFAEKIAEIEGKDEFGLRARWRDVEGITREVGETDEAVRQKKEYILTLPESKRRTELIDIGHLVQAAVEQNNEKWADGLMEELTPLFLQAKKNKTYGDALVLNAAFLVDHKRQAAFDQAIEEIFKKYGEKLHLKYVGPVPPFNFVEIVIKWKEEIRNPNIEKRNKSEIQNSK